MFCPNCGKSEQSPETYCRQCGVFLNDYTKKKKRGFGGDTPQDQINTNLFLNLISAIVTIASAITLYVIFGSRGNEFPIVFFIAAMLTAVGGWQLSTFFINLKLKKKIGNKKFAGIQTETGIHQTNPEKTFAPAETKKILPEADFKDVISPSVTEDTTKNLNKNLR